MSAVVLAAFEVPRPEFDGDERRTILFLQHVFGEVLKRSIDEVVDALASGGDPLGAVDSAIRKSSVRPGSRAHLAALARLGRVPVSRPETGDPLSGYSDVLRQRFADDVA